MQHPDSTLRSALIHIRQDDAGCESVLFVVNLSCLKVAAAIYYVFSCPEAFPGLRRLHAARHDEGSELLPDRFFPIRLEIPQRISIFVK